MSAIISFDIRHFSTHVSHLSSKHKMIFKIISNIFVSLDNAINESRNILAIKDKTFVNHTGDGFVAIFSGQGKSLQSLMVASLIASDVENFLGEYNHNAEKYMQLNYIPPLNYGIGIHTGIIKKFNYHPEYPGNTSMVAFLGHGINLSSRVQESTKDHTFKIICTKNIYEKAISVIKDRHRGSIEKYLTPIALAPRM